MVKPWEIDRRTGTSYKRPTTPAKSPARNAVRPRNTPSQAAWINNFKADANRSLTQAGKIFNDNRIAMGASRLHPPKPAPAPPGGAPPRGPSGGNRFSYGRGGRGGGGGGGGSAAAEAAKQVAALQQLLNSKAFQAKSIDDDLARVGTAVSADQQVAGEQYDQLGAFMKLLANPWENMEMTATPTVDPSLMPMLSSMGGDTAGYEAQVGLANTLGAQGDASSDRLRQQLSGANQETNQSRQAETQMASVFANRELGAQKSQLEEVLRQRQAEEQRGMDAQKLQVVMQLISAMSQGGNTVDVSQFFK